MTTMPPFPRILATTALCLAAGAYCPQVKAAPRHEGTGNCYLARVSMDKLCWLPHVVSAGACKKAYEAISFQAVSAGGTLSISIRNTGKKRYHSAFNGGAHQAVESAFLCAAGEEAGQTPLVRVPGNCSGRGIAPILSITRHQQQCRSCWVRLSLGCRGEGV